MTGDDPEVLGLLAGGGLSWSWDLDVDALLAAVSQITPASPVRPGSPATGTSRVASGQVEAGQVAAGQAGAGQAGAGQVEAEFAEYLEAVDAGRSALVPLSAVAGVLAESLPPGPDLAGWLASSPARTAGDPALAGLASSYRRLASWAQAGELAAVAQLASRSAAADARIGTSEDGRPGTVSPDACGQVSLALTMSQASASWWADLAVTLRWRLPGTGDALRAGDVDLSRARAIAEATSVLDEETARAVESRVLPRAGTQTLGQLRSALRRAVIAADPHGAERRREAAEQRARVTLYPDAEGTAALAGYSLPGVLATAALARITALAQAMKAAGSGGGMDLLRSKVFLGLLLGTQPYIPPAPDGPPDSNCPPDDGCPPDSECPPGDEGCPPGDSTAPGFCASAPGAPDSSAADSSAAEAPANGSPGGSPMVGSGQWPEVTAFIRPGPAAMGHLIPAGSGFLELKVPWSTLTGDCTEPGYLGRLGAITPAQASCLAHLADRDPAVDWRVIVTGPDGSALAVAGIQRSAARAGPGPPASAAAQRRDDHCGLIRRVSVMITRDDLAGPSADQGRIAGWHLAAKLARIRAAANRAADRADRQAAADATAAGGCAHTEATKAYRPPPRLTAHITARDLTCRFPTCRQPAARCDVDHTTPYDQGGKTCLCNLGELCRHHHKLKQHPRWHLTQPAPGTFIWTTPTGHSYTSMPDLHAT